MELKEKAAYLKGLAEGLEFDKETKEGKLIAALIDLTAELCDAVEVLDADMDELVDEVVELREYIEEIDDDLNDVEEFLDEEVDLEDWDDEDEDEDEEDDEWCDGDCDGCCGCGDEFFEIVCPSCGETICFDESVDPENLVCPACNEKFACIVEEDDLATIEEE
jgi:hypothetical protein